PRAVRADRRGVRTGGDHRRTRTLRPRAPYPRPRPRDPRTLHHFAGLSVQPVGSESTTTTAIASFLPVLSGFSPHRPNPHDLGADAANAVDLAADLQRPSRLVMCFCGPLQPIASTGSTSRVYAADRRRLRCRVLW